VIFVVLLFVVEDEAIECDICGTSVATTTCSECDNKMTCEECDVKWHGHFKRRHHSRCALVLPGASSMSSVNIPKRDDSSRRALLLPGASLLPPVDIPNRDNSKSIPLQTVTSKSLDLDVLVPITQSKSSEQDDIMQIMALAKFPPNSSISLPTVIDMSLTPSTSAKVLPVNSKVPLRSAVVMASQDEPRMPVLTAASAVACSSFGPEDGKRLKLDEELKSNMLKNRVVSSPADIVSRELKSPVAACASLGMFPVEQKGSAAAVASNHKSKVVQMQEEVCVV